LRFPGLLRKIAYLVPGPIVETLIVGCNVEKVEKVDFSPRAY
jgi:hypothetical protein